MPHAVYYNALMVNTLWDITTKDFYYSTMGFVSKFHTAASVWCKIKRVYKLKSIRGNCRPSASAGQRSFYCGTPFEMWVGRATLTVRKVETLTPFSLSEGSIRAKKDGERPGMNTNSSFASSVPPHLSPLIIIRDPGNLSFSQQEERFSVCAMAVFTAP